MSMRHWIDRLKKLKNLNGPLLWIALVVGMPIWLLISLSYIASMFATATAFAILRALLGQSASEKYDKVLNQGVVIVSVALVVLLWHHQLDQMTDHWNLSHLSASVKSYLLYAGILFSAVLAYALIFIFASRLFNQYPIIQLILIVIVAALICLRLITSSQQACEYGVDWGLSGIGCQ
jgi:hypothetical protein